MSNTQKVLYMAMLVAIDVVLSRFLAVNTPILRASFNFIPIAVAAILFGPVWAAAGAAAADIIGATLFPVVPYFYGFTVSAALTGLIYGIFLYKRKVSWRTLIAPVLLVTLGVNVGLGTLWLHMTMGKAFLAMLPTRLAKNLLMIPIQIVVVMLIAHKVVPLLKKKA